MASKNVDIFLSGGGTNTDPNASLGGITSTAKLFGQLPVFTAAMAGVTLLDSVNLSSVELTFTVATKLLRINEVGDGKIINDVDVSVDGEYILTTPDGLIELTVSVVNASLPAVDEVRTVTATDIMHNLFDEVSAADSQIGDINYRHVYLKNRTTSPLSLKVLVKSQLNGLDYIEIGLFSTSSGNTDELLTNESTAPTSVVFDAPVLVDDAILLSLTAFGQIGVYIKRTVLALTDVSTPVDTAVLEIIEYS